MCIRDRIRRDYKFEDKSRKQENELPRFKPKNNSKKYIKIWILKKSTYTDGILPNDSYHPIQYKMAAINNFFHRINSCIEDEENRKKEIEWMK